MRLNVQNLQTYIDNGNFIKKLMDCKGCGPGTFSIDTWILFCYSNRHKVALLGVENLPILSSLSMSVRSNDDDDDAHHNLASMAEM